MERPLQITKCFFTLAILFAFVLSVNAQSSAKSTMSIVGGEERSRERQITNDTSDQSYTNGTTSLIDRAERLFKKRMQEKAAIDTTTEFASADEGNNAEIDHPEQAPDKKNLVLTAEMVSLYPNPAGEILNVEVVDLKQIEVIDMMGRIVLKKAAITDHERLDVSALREGLYFIRLTISDNQAVVAKFVKR